MTAQVALNASVEWNPVAHAHRAVLDFPHATAACMDDVPDREVSSQKARLNSSPHP
jgi:hypothetical protein